MVLGLFVVSASAAPSVWAQSSPTEPEAAPAATAPDPSIAQPGPGEVAPATQPPVNTSPESSMALASEPQRDVVERTWPNRPLLITGAVVLVGSYGASAIVAAASDRKADDKLYYPVVGPWLDLKNRDCDVNPCGSDGFNKALLIADGAVQGLGALSVLLGLVLPESEKKPWYLIGTEDVVVAPQMGSAQGLRVYGQF
ncbi:MAG: hypothetical protein EOO73_17220 [Myxococcales bacterium]|nr:MAG: hypothetical protein EOO73_17220 [Myxococcales bacterium]